MLAAAELSAKGQVVTPKPVREAVGLEAGNFMVFAVDGDRVIAQKLVLGDVLREAEIAYREKRTLSVDEAFKGLG